MAVAGFCPSPFSATKMHHRARVLISLSEDDMARGTAIPLAETKVCSDYDMIR
jgi:hypothetical protein